MPVTARPSLRYELILNGAVRQYPGGREVCCGNKLGREEYKRRIAVMVLRQHGRCKWCLKALYLDDATFDHEKGRGMGGSHIDERLTDSEGNELNAAIHLVCNLAKGSRRGYEHSTTAQ